MNSIIKGDRHRRRCTYQKQASLSGAVGHLPRNWRKNGDASVESVSGFRVFLFFRRFALAVFLNLDWSIENQKIISPFVFYMTLGLQDQLIIMHVYRKNS